MKKFVCPVCGYSVIAETAPEKCPVCGVPGTKFKVEEADAEMTWAAEHVVGVAKDVDPEIKKGLVDNFNGECCEVGMYLAMARVAHREGYPEIGLYYEKAAWEEAEHAAKFAELLRSRHRQHQKESGTSYRGGKRRNRRQNRTCGHGEKAKP